MNAIILAEAEEDLEQAFNYYESQRVGLGTEMIEEYRRGLEMVIAHPRAWQPLDELYRRDRLRRFPYGIVYCEESNQILIVAVMHLSQEPDSWRDRRRSR